jgi:hypothetical protein
MWWLLSDAGGGDDMILKGIDRRYQTGWCHNPEDRIIVSNTTDVRTY